MDKSEFVRELSKLNPSSTFLTLHKYHNEAGEVADHNIVFHMSYESALKRSILALEDHIACDDLHVVAKSDLIASFINSLNKIDQTSIDEIDDAYQRFFDSNGNYIKGVKLHRESNQLHLYGLAVHKKIYVKGKYTTVNHKPLTIAKNNLRKLCPVSKFRQFRIMPEQVEKISVQHLSLLPPDC